MEPINENVIVARDMLSNLDSKSPSYVSQALLIIGGLLAAIQRTRITSDDIGNLNT